MVFDYSGSLYEAVGNVAKNFCRVFWFTGTTVLMERRLSEYLNQVLPNLQYRNSYWAVC